MPSCNSSGVEIVYDVMGPAGSRKMPVFFIAGLNGMRGSCMKQAVPFAQERPVVLHDHRGTGASGKPPGVYSVENMAKDVVAVMDALGIPKAHMVGTSLGGAIAQVLCLDHPDRVQSAGILCSYVKMDAFMQRQFEVRKKVLLAMGTEALMHLTSTTLNDPHWFATHFDELREREKFLLGNASPPAIDAERIDAVMRFDRSARLGEIRKPCFVIGARNDVVCPPGHSEELARRIPGARLKLYPDGGHFFYIVHADELNADIRAFMAQNE